MTEKKVGSATKVKNLFKEATAPLTISDIRVAYPELKPNEISMALCYLLNQKYLTRESIENKVKGGRKNVFSYTYHPNKVEVANEQN